ncbi:helix-turn-helix domain-containing protein [Microbacterium sp. SLBN-111]|uniref:helix-turn-helix domain-containing protein n=1 Tax=Microbacterium sp. SLBN-111 TaxID=3377733 RepID=UPI003C76F09E
MPFGSVRVRAYSDPRASVPVFDARDGEAWMVISLDRPPSAQGGVHEQRTCVALVATDPDALPSLLPTRSFLTLSFPAAVFQGIGLDAVGALAVDVGSALFWPFLTFAWVCATAERRQTGLTLYYTERLLQEMVVGVVVASLRGEQARIVTEDYSAALSIIAARVGDPGLTPAAIAAELNTSLRSLQRQFASRGTTLDRSIRAARVGHARSLLEDPVYDSLTIERVAHACGLANGSSLARAFAAEGLPSPAVVRATARRH